MPVRSLRRLVAEITMEGGRSSTVGGGGVYALLDMTVKNVSSSPMEVDVGDVRLSTGEKYSSADNDLAYAVRLVKD